MLPISPFPARSFHSVHAERIAAYEATRLERQARSFRLAPDTGHEPIRLPQCPCDFCIRARRHDA